MTQEIQSDFEEDSVEDTEIEKIDETSGVITRPFDPNLIKIEHEPYNVGQLLERLEHNEINLDTEFQRSFVWDNIKQSRLIESILLNLPLPSFYFDGRNNNFWDVVDGFQRISTLKSFVLDKTLILQDLEFLTNLNGSSFDSLARELQRRIKTFKVTIFVIQKDTPLQVKYILFRRINTGGLVLTPQEIRHAINPGVPANLLKELANSDEFITATDKSISKKRMADRDFVNRFVAFYLNEYNDYEPDLDGFMTDSMGKIGNLTDEKRDLLVEDFLASMRICYKIFEKDAFRRPNKDSRRQPINKALFEALSVSIAKLKLTDRLMLQAKKTLFREKLAEMLKTPVFVESITQGTGQKDKVKTRFNSLKKIIEETIQRDVKGTRNQQFQVSS